MRAPFLALLVLALGLCLGPVSHAQGLSAGAGLAQPQVAGLGDSITAGNEDGSGITWPNQLLAQRPTYWVYNNGIGGQQSGQIAVRMNAFAGQSQQTFSAGFTIPTSGSVVVTFPSGYEPCFNSSGPGVLIQTIVSSVTYQGYCSDNGSRVYSFTPTTYPGSPVTVPSANPWTAVIGNLLKGYVVIEAGRNAFASGHVLSDIAAMVAVVRANNGHAAVMTILNAAWTTEWAGQPDYITIMALNASIISTYGSDAMDVRTALINAYDPSNPADVIDHGHDVPPYSLRSKGVAGTVTGLSSVGTCAFTTSVAISTGVVVAVDSEKIFVSSGSNGAYTCTRGYASTTAATHTNGVAFTSVDGLHPGQNPTSPSNPNCVNGYICVANTVKAWLDANGL